MIVDEHVRDYINSLNRDNNEELRALEAWALDNQVPIIRREAQTLLRFLIRTRKPKQILEIGTAVGFSALFMNECSEGKIPITTIEKVEMRLKHARRNLSGHENVRLMEGDAGELLKGLQGEYDFIFLDAAKGQYMNLLPELTRLLAVDGMLVTDNVLQEGSLAGSKFAVVRRDRTIHMRMREYMHAITHMEELDTVVLPVGDGMSLSVRRGNNHESAEWRSV